MSSFTSSLAASSAVSAAATAASMYPTASSSAAAASAAAAATAAAASAPHPFFSLRSLAYLATGVACGLFLINLSNSWTAVAAAAAATAAASASSAAAGGSGATSSTSSTAGGGNGGGSGGGASGTRASSLRVGRDPRRRRLQTLSFAPEPPSPGTGLGPDDDDDGGGASVGAGGSSDDLLSAAAMAVDRPGSVASSRSDSSVDREGGSSSRARARRRRQERRRRQLQLQVELQLGERDAASGTRRSVTTDADTAPADASPLQSGEGSSSSAASSAFSLDPPNLSSDTPVEGSSASATGPPTPTAAEGASGTATRSGPTVRIAASGSWDASSSSRATPVLLSPIHSEGDDSPATERRRGRNNRVSWIDGGDLAANGGGAAGNDTEPEHGDGNVLDDGAGGAGAGRRGSLDSTGRDVGEGSEPESFSDVNDDLDTEGEDDESMDGSKDGGYAEESKNLLNLLYAIAEDQSRKDGFVHRSITCNHCNLSPIRGYRFKCANCVDFDLCETCEAAEVHTKTHVFIKIRIPIPPHANPRSTLIPPFYPGTGFASEQSPTVDYKELQNMTHFDVVELEGFYEQYRSLATVESGDTSEGGITREVFEKCLGPLGMEKNLITDRIFAFFDQDEDGLISFKELVCGMSILCKGSLDERITYAFRGYDLDGDGKISREELHRMFKAYFYLSMELVRDFVKTMEEGMMETFDDEASKPVSASFSAPIVGSGVVPGDDDSDDGAAGDKDDHGGEAAASILLSNATAAAAGGGGAGAAASHQPSAAAPGPADLSLSAAAAGPSGLMRRMKERRRLSALDVDTSAATATSSTASGTPGGGALFGGLVARAGSPTPASALPPSPTAAAMATAAPQSGIGGSTSTPAGLLSRGTRAYQEAQLKRRSSSNLAAAYRPPSAGAAASSASSSSAAAASLSLATSPLSLPTPTATAPALASFASSATSSSSWSSSTSAGGIGVGGPASTPLGDMLVSSPVLAGGGAAGGMEELAFEAGMMDPEEAQWPIIEAMSQDAIEEMVEKTFVAAGAADSKFITLEEFRRAVESDNSYLQWFEALGSVF